VSDDYPMRTLDEAAASIKRAVNDRRALIIGDAKLQEVRNAYSRRVMEIKKAALMNNAASVSIKSSLDASRRMHPASVGSRPTSRRAPRGR